ncbi:MAG TPA: MscL family protein [Ornithinibacter sp.]|jgi:large conductance mechanosensitive channel|uniref:MscL family protein n=1 Tax=Ornithinibacter sp. TaxID=2862748 RepID=UPI001B3F12AA|nr:MscL family protein [Ornithinibacter sp.]MBP6524608.1 MscL family protein [Dermatophilaceae bacterium]MBU9944306.1 MscL family protein [Dermatophilaceae bacterium]HNV41116.1 MscL family protein [Ornithinibacter sp.]HOB79288.1 MscL family protein [Ornithinibacter sp.]HPV90778.1 MscL family protein [Ornithinibacter sp.]
MKGFKDFILRGNLIELAVAFIVGAAFATLVKAFTEVIIELLAKAGGAPSFDEWKPFGMSTVGPFLTALVAFLIMAFIVYFFIVKPYELAKEKFVKSEEEDAAPNADTVLLTEIRDALLRDRA